MKNRTDLILLILFFLSMAVCVVLWFVDLMLLLYVPVMPAFCIQLWLCRRSTSRPLRATPLIVIAAFAALGGVVVLGSNGWDQLLGWIMMLISISPAVGCLLALGGYAVYHRPKEDHP